VPLPHAPYDGVTPAPLTAGAVGEFLRCALGLSAWKQYGTSRWALRVNPSSGNLHPTEAYVVWNGRVCHYAPKEHALEERCVLDGQAGLLVGLSSIHWREAWKYGERAFRYCQHDVGHAIGALRISAARLGWRLALLPEWSDPQIATLLGLDRDADFAAAEREAPDCLAVVTAADVAPRPSSDPAPLVEQARRASWTGAANTLSPAQDEWPIIDEVAAASVKESGSHSIRTLVSTQKEGPDQMTRGVLYTRQLLLQRRSATAFAPNYALRRDTFLSMLERLQPDAPPWDAIDWPPHVHLVLFVHRVDGLVPGVYAYLRSDVLDEWKAAMRPEFIWEQPAGDTPLYLLVPIDVRRSANRVSCDQDIAGDGFFSLGMLARFEGALRERGAWFYRRLFWECGLIGQVLYLEAEAASVRATGIGCFYDDPVHELLGLGGYAWQSLYHLAMGMPVDDARLTTAPGYAWEVSRPSAAGSGQ
jgi:nitroreductase